MISLHETVHLWELAKHLWRHSQRRPKKLFGRNFVIFPGRFSTLPGGRLSAYWSVRARLAIRSRKTFSDLPAAPLPLHVDS
jgi:hypothetical protein